MIDFSGLSSLPERIWIDAQSSVFGVYRACKVEPNLMLRILIPSQVAVGWADSPCNLALTKDQKDIMFLALEFNLK